MYTVLTMLMMFSECTALPAIWSNMDTDTVFPINSGEVAIVTCSTGYRLSGDNNITCQEGTEFSYTVIPTCSVLGKLFNKILSCLHQN